MIVLVALSAAIFAALLIPFQAIPLIPGHVSLRVADIMPTALGLLFGPAGAWGAAIGNLIGDFFGTLSPGAIGGFVANFMNAYISYKLWNALSPLKDMGINLTSVRRIARYQVIQMVRQCGLVLILTWWVALMLGLAPAEIYFLAVIIPAWLLTALVTPFIIRIIYPRIRKWGLLWTDIMAPEEVSAGPARKAGVVLCVIGAVGGAAALAISLYGLGLSSADLAAKIIPIPFLVLYFVGALMLGGREQVTAMQAERSAASQARRGRKSDGAAG